MRHTPRGGGIGRTLGAAAALLCAAAALGQATTNPSAGNPSAGSPNNPSAGSPSAQGAGAARQGWWNDAVFYEVFVRSFYDTRDPAAGALAGDGIGDLRGLIEKLDYLNDGDPATDTDLGVTALWLMPITDSPSYHGYDTTDYKKIEPDYGTNEDFLRLMQECRKRGIRVIIDLVLNHTSSRHPLFQKALDPSSPERDLFIWAETDPGYRGAWNQQVWHRARGADGVTRFYFGMFSGQMPDVNYRQEGATRFALDVVDFWLKDMQIDGFRLDAIRHLFEEGQKQENVPATYDWLRGFFRHYTAVNPDAYTVGEVWSSTEVASGYVGGMLDNAFEFDLSYAIVRAINNMDGAQLGAQAAKSWRAFPRNQFATFLTNHDQPRLMTELTRARVNDADARAKVAAAALLTLPGVPYLYFGEEIGMVGDKPDENIRTPMQWEPNPRTAGFTTGKPWREPQKNTQRSNVRTQQQWAHSILTAYKKLIRLRLGDEAIRRGGFVQARASDKALTAFVRTQPGPDGRTARAVLVILNFSDSPKRGFVIDSEATGLPGVGGARDLLAGVLSRQSAGAKGPETPTLRQGALAGYEPGVVIPPWGGVAIELVP